MSHSREPLFNNYMGNMWEKFDLVSEDFVRKVILESPKTFCPLDILPVHLFFDCIDVLLPHITSIINKSLESGIVPSCFKEAIIKPLLKKSNLDKDIFKNYRPVSNLSFLSKILERIVFYQLDKHLNANSLRETHQSAYRQKHSTETALLKVTSDLLTACDEGMVSVLALLDLSAAFDTIDHEILITRLNVSFGLSGIVLKWFTSYISDRYQKVIINENMSRPRLFKTGIHKGSVLGPVLFSLYSQSVTEIIKNHGFNYHVYADDTQLYKSTPASNVEKIIKELSTCVFSIQEWMTSNKLKMNNEKTEIMLIGTSAKLKSIEQFSTIKLNTTEIVSSPCIKNLGVKLDADLSMEKAISCTRKACYLELRKISQIRSYISESATKQLIQAFVISKLDYCNSLLAGVSESKIMKLQQIQNHAARLIKRVPQRESITPILKELHWLPVKARIDYKMLVMTYQCLYEPSFPKYLSDKITVYTPTRSLRSYNKNFLVKPKANLRNYGERTFFFKGPSLWNDLHPNIQSANSLAAFKTNVKTFLFKSYYGLM